MFIEGREGKESRRTNSEKSHHQAEKERRRKGKGMVGGAVILKVLKEVDLFYLKKPTIFVFV